MQPMQPMELQQEFMLDLVNNLLELDDKVTLPQHLALVLHKAQVNWNSTVLIASRAKRRCAPQSARLCVNQLPMRAASVLQRCSALQRMKRFAPLQSV